MTRKERFEPVENDLINDGAGTYSDKPGMRLIPGGTYWIGSNDHYPEEMPARRVAVDSFWIDLAPVTNADFQKFVDATGYVTTAEQTPNPMLYPEADPSMLKPGSSLFVKPTHPVDLTSPFQWWKFCHGANWFHPLGPKSDLRGLLDHPVVHVSYDDAETYASWAGKCLPSEAEWEVAARGGLDRKPYAWGDELEPKGMVLANYWQGAFPSENLLLDGYERTSPVRHYPPNGFGLYDMIGNVWEWTSDWYVERPSDLPSRSCCVPRNPRGGSERESRAVNDPGSAFGRKVLKGGSHLCAANYCQRYRPAARYPQTVDTSTSHIGFRCAIR